MENSFKALIDSAQEVLILLPSKPNMDQVAAGLSLYLSLNSSNKKAIISCSAPMVTEFSRLIAVDKISSNLGNKNLNISFVNYDASGIDKVNYDIENSQFKLTITPKSGLISPTTDQIKISYSGIIGDMVILVGGNNDSDFPELKKEEFKNAKLIHVGTKLLEVLSSDLPVLSFARPTSSTSELVAFLIKESNLAIDQDVATNLLAGIEEQSKNFQGEDVTANTFGMFADLLKLGGHRLPKIMPANTYPIGSIPNKPFNQTDQKQQPLTAEAVGRQMTPEEAEMELNQEIPASWSEPKIFTGTSLS